jgi:hypothetical protein
MPEKRARSKSKKQPSKPKRAAKAKTKAKPKATKAKTKTKTRTKTRAKAKTTQQTKTKAKQTKQAKQPKQPKVRKGGGPATFATLAAWTQVPTSEADFDFGEATNDSVHYEDTFGETPEHLMIHEGNVAVAGPVELSGWDAPKGAQQTVYIVDGNLDIAGPLAFSQSDIMTTLWVTGDLTVDRLVTFGSAMLIVGGTLAVKEVAATYLDDAGHLIVHGAFVAPTWIDLARGRGCIELSRVDTAFVSDYYAAQEPRPNEPDDEGMTVPSRPWNLAAAATRGTVAAALHAGDDGPDPRQLFDAIRTGAPVLA